MHCPHCQSHELTQEFYEKKVNFRCDVCGGRWLTLHGLRSLCADRAFVDELWRTAKYGDSAEGVICSSCGKTMRQVSVPLRGTMIELDVCCHCQSVWFDPSELEAIPLPELSEDEKLPQKAKEILAMHRLEMIDAQQRAEPDTPDAADSAWRYLVAVLGGPLEENMAGCRRRPFITWGLAAVCAAVFALCFTHLREAIDTWGFIPAQWSRYGGLTIVTSMFLHGGLFHLIGNLYFLLVFGDNVEDEFGRWKYTGLVIASGLCAILSHAVFDPRPEIPCVGASGFISGVIAAYAICFPRAKLSFMIASRGSLLALSQYSWVTIPAWSAFLLWIGFQILMAAKTDPGVGGTAYMAHIGGALPGIIFALYLRFGWKKENRDFMKSLDDLENAK